ncbi:hypothetical protein [uncultured Polaribacter sp.]|uniref:hypothetical protein n=1 Tax=uncultured Polaribacter sp. TaxID=174711 RepID=UPI0026235F5C|nr:hypothetical protein [uncultured Polaribacter sp.]
MFFIEAGREYAGVYRNNTEGVSNRRMFRSAVREVAVNKWTHITLNLEGTISADLPF